MPGNESEAGRQKGYTGKLIEGSCGGPAHDPIGYLETLLEYFLPGLKHQELDDEAFAKKVAHLLYIRRQLTEHKTDQ